MTAYLLILLDSQRDIIPRYTRITVNGVEVADSQLAIEYLSTALNINMNTHLSKEEVGDLSKSQCLLPRQPEVNLIPNYLHLEITTLESYRTLKMDSLQHWNHKLSS